MYNTIKKKRLILGLLVIAWMAVIFAFSSQGHDTSSEQSGSIVTAIRQATSVTVPEFIVRKSAHIFIYSVLGVLVAIFVSTHHWRPRKTILISWLIVILYASSDEFHQHFVPGRSAEVRDVIIDSTAALISITITTILYRTYVLHKKQR